LSSSRRIRCEFPTSGQVNIEKPYQELCDSLLICGYAIYSLWPSQELVPCWDKDTLYRPFLRAPKGLTLAEPPRPDFHGSTRRGRSDGNKLSIPSSSRNRKAWSTINILCNCSRPSSHLCPVSANSIASHLVKNGHTRRGAASQQGSSTRRFSTYGRFENPRKKYLWPLYARGACYHPQAPEARKVSWFGFYLTVVHTPSVRLSNPGYVH